MFDTPRSPKDIFLAAIEKATPAERAAFLDEACAGDAALRQRVEELLKAHDEPGSFLGQPPAAPPADTSDIPPGQWVDREALAPAPLEGPGTRLGPYKLLQKLGEGGMGAVYMAEQEQPVRRRVALKIIKAGMDSAHVLVRFEAERQVLALMDHPNIAKVLDAGTTDAGRPYFVMELVKGIPITKYCDQEHLTPRERLELFVPVCQAVQHAHQKGIIHRDLKPSNVLIALYDGRPVPKVIDFGVAKATAQKLTERTMFTEVGQIIGTLEYMAPEQAELNNLDIDTRADIYSLGVLLYELLTGSPPFTAKQLRSAAFTEMLRMIREVEPPKPSTKLSNSEELPAIAAKRKLEPKRLTRLMQGDLDWIVMKAVEKDRGRRYETANGLARDVERYLHDEPVEACPPSTVYRLRKYLRRHKGPVLAAAVVLLALVGGTVGTTIGLVQARQAEGRARAERDKAKAISQFLTEDLLVQAEPDKNAPMDQVSLLEVVDRAAAQVSERFADQPLLEAEIRKTLGQVYYGLGQLDQAEHHLRAALATNRRLLGEEDPDTYRTMAVLGCLLSGRREEQLRLLEASVAGLSATLGKDHPDTLMAKTSLICVYIGDGRITLFLPFCEETLRLAKARLGPEHRDTWYSMVNVAEAYQAAGRTAEGLSLNEEALRLARAKLGPDNLGTLVVMAHLARLYQQAGRLTDALSLYEEILRISRTKLGPDHPQTLGAMSTLANGYQAAGRFADALPLYEEGLRLSQAKLGPDHPQTLGAMSTLAKRYQAAGRLADALPLYEEGLRLSQAKLGPDHPQTLDWMYWLALAYREAGKLEREESLWRELLERQREKAGPQSAATADILVGLGRNLLKQHRYADAEPLLRDCLAIIAQQQPDDLRRFNRESMLGGALLGQQKYAEAEPLLVKGYEGLKQRQDKIPAQWKIILPEALERLVQLYDATGQKAKADEWRKKLEETKAAAKPPTQP
jgi:serine/threonine protein kinase